MIRLEKISRETLLINPRHVVYVGNVVHDLSSGEEIFEVCFSNGFSEFFLANDYDKLVKEIDEG